MRVGPISDPLIPSYHKIGFRGIGKYIVESKAGQIWAAMLYRCYGKNNGPTYKDCSVDPRWHNFQNFAAWFEEHYVKDWQLDKDILVPGNKIYGPDTCCFVPREINCLFNKEQINKKSLSKGIFKHGNKFKVEGTRSGIKVYLGLHSSLELAQIIYKEFKEKRIKEEAEIYKNLLNKKIYNILINYKL